MDIPGPAPLSIDRLNLVVERTRNLMRSERSRWRRRHRFGHTALSVIDDPTSNADLTTVELVPHDKPEPITQRVRVCWMCEALPEPRDAQVGALCGDHQRQRFVDALGLGAPLVDDDARLFVGVSQCA